MRFEDWEPHYIRILDYFGFEREDDERAAQILSELISNDALPQLEKCCRGNDVTVCGNAPCLKEELDLIHGTVFAADAAADFLYSKGILPDAVFTDLDGAEESFIEMSREGTIMVVHAHGDNIPLLKNRVPRFEGPVVATTQSAPISRVHNFGGFTDGDRAIFTADALSAASVTIVGFDLDDTGVDPVKRGKLMLARELLAMIGYDV